MTRFICLALLLFSWSASAYFQMDLLKAKKTNKEATQWTLVDWLAQKNRMRLLDHWLALNTSANGVELNLSASQNRYRVRTDDNAGSATVDRDSQAYQLDLYLWLFNLTGEYEKTDDQKESYGGAAGLRLLGTSSQTTNLIARYGWRRLRHLSTQEDWENQYLEGQLQLYIIKQFGLQGKYRHYFPSDSNLGTRLEGHRVTAGAFLELFIFRVYGDFYQEPMQRTANGAITKEKREGIEYGLKLFF